MHSCAIYTLNHKAGSNNQAIFCQYAIQNTRNMSGLWHPNIKQKHIHSVHQQNVVESGYVFLLVTKTQIFPTTLDLGLGANAAGWHEKLTLRTQVPGPIGEHKCIEFVHPLRNRLYVLRIRDFSEPIL